MGKCVHYVTEVYCIRVLLLLIIPYITVNCNLFLACLAGSQIEGVTCK